MNRRLVGFLALIAAFALVFIVQVNLYSGGGYVPLPSDLLQRACPDPAPRQAPSEPGSAVPAQLVSRVPVSDRRDRVSRRVADYIQSLQSRIHDYANTKYLIYSEPGGVGVGNRMNALTTAIMFAMESNRTFLIKRSEFLEEFSPLFPWHLPDFDTVFTAEQRASSFLFRFECCDMSNKTWLAWLEASGRPYVLDLDLGEGSHFNQMACDDWANRYKEYKFIEFRTNQYMIPFAMYNPHYTGLMQSLFETFEPMGVLARSMLILNPAIRSIIDKFKAKHEFDKYFTVGIQIRTYLFNRGRHDPVNQINRFFHCADKAESIYRESIDDERPTRLFVCSDNQTMLGELKQKHGDRLVHFVASEDMPSGLDKRQFDAWLRLVEILIVSECNDMVLSDFSTFSTIASGVSSKRPYVLLQEGICVQRVNADPCFTYSWALPYQSCYANAPGYQRDWGLCQHDYWRTDPWAPRPYTVPRDFDFDMSYAGSGLVFSNRNRTVVGSPAKSHASVLGMPLLVGKHKFYWETKLSRLSAASSAGHVFLGIATRGIDVNAPLNLQKNFSVVVDDANLWVVGESKGAAMSSGWKVEDFIGMHFDPATFVLNVYVNKKKVGTVTVPSGEYYPAFATGTDLDVLTIYPEAQLPDGVGL
eukprot:TRINITY_DN7246_c0_g1_i1.p1 TRINITY_DN7246_c0_g1~~TRINITY_DN7246_c0_g1_i1.p1  ORF type:complete len:644 (-),score=219.24 TRINITY_DN7246_c0_g1_i1:357-2288(-)